MPPERCSPACGHGVGALVDEPDGVVELERAGGDERRVLAERVAGRGDRLAGVVLGVVASPARHASHAATEHRNSAGCW